jgi:hypothetical protein
MASCVAICWLSNKQWIKCVPNPSNPYPHSHVKILDVESKIKSRQKHNIEVKVKCTMWNKWIHGLVINHSLTPLLEQERMRVLDVEEMESSSNIDLRDVSWWMSIKKAYRLEALVIARFLKEGCISLNEGGRPFHTTRRHDKSRCAPPWTWETYSSKHRPIGNTKPIAQIQSP